MFSPILAVTILSCRHLHILGVLHVLNKSREDDAVSSGASAHDRWES